MQRYELLDYNPTTPLKEVCKAIQKLNENELYEAFFEGLGNGGIAVVIIKRSGR